MTDTGPLYWKREDADALHTLLLEKTRQYGIMFYDAERRITGWNSGAEFITGWTAPEVLGQPTAMLFVPEDRAHRLDEHEANTAALVGSVKTSAGTCGATAPGSGRVASACRCTAKAGG